MLPLLKLRPVLLPKPWGGDALWRVLRKGNPGDTGMGEAWEVSDRPEAPSVVAEGPLAGKTLADVLATHAPDVLGDAAKASQDFPLLHKFISAREKLSVQVHPGADSPLGEAKTECWYIVDAEPGASLIVGVDPGGLDRDATLERLKSAACESVLRRLPARRGDVFFIPAGTVHAITEGILLYEVQQNSDTTFRLYDWGRVDAHGHPRALHLEEAAAVADVTARAGYRIPSLRVARGTHAEDYLVACPWFTLVRWSGFAADAPARLGCFAARTDRRCASAPATPRWFRPATRPSTSARNPRMSNWSSASCPTSTATSARRSVPRATRRRPSTRCSGRRRHDQ